MLGSGTLGTTRIAHGARAAARLATNSPAKRQYSVRRCATASTASVLFGARTVTVPPVACSRERGESADAHSSRHGGGRSTTETSMVPSTWVELYTHRGAHNLKHGHATATSVIVELLVATVGTALLW